MTERGGGAYWDKFLSLIKFPPSEPPLSMKIHLTLQYMHFKEGKSKLQEEFTPGQTWVVSALLAESIY